MKISAGQQNTLFYQIIKSAALKEGKVFNQYQADVILMLSNVASAIQTRKKNNAHMPYRTD